MFGFGTSSSSSSSTKPESTEPPTAPNREQRAACWSSRDAYFDCLNRHNVLRAGDEKPGEGGGKEGGKGVCLVEREGYEKNCGKSWIDYFNKRRTLEFRQRLTVDAANQRAVPTPGR